MGGAGVQVPKLYVKFQWPLFLALKTRLFAQKWHLDSSMYREEGGGSNGSRNDPQIIIFLRPSLKSFFSSDNLFSGKAMDGSMRTDFPVNMSFSAKASKSRWVSHSFIGWCCPQFPSSFLLKRTLIAWLCGRVSQSLSWVLLDPSAQLEITLPDTSNSAFSSHKYFHFHSGPLNNIRQKWEYRRWELPPGEGDTASGGDAHPQNSVSAEKSSFLVRLFPSTFASSLCAVHNDTAVN